MAWFKNWFNTHYYHLLYQHRDDVEAQAFVARLLSNLALKPQADILDLACGKGRHARFMAQQGYHVVGIDLSEASIAEAQQWANEQLQFYVQDMREVFRTDSFDLVCNLFTSFGYFEQNGDNLRTLQAVYAALRPDAYLVIDFLNLPYTIAQLRPAETKAIANVHFNISRKVENGYIIKTIDVYDGEQTFHFVERVQALSLADFEAYFQQSGFELRQVWGNYALQPYEPNTSDRLIMVARKGKAII
ncbi:MAG: methyltransferase domain-containing protein [Sphingobacteriales bacterium]|nr:methyltransferase domain-containing protein [Sphingobacteriales bacterium]